METVNSYVILDYENNSRCRDDSTSANKSVWYAILTEWRIRVIWSPQ